MLDFIPLIFVCGTKGSTKALGQARSCPNCGTKDGAQLYETYSRFHFCFLPLCRTGFGSRSFRCGHCGAQYPA